MDWKGYTWTKRTGGGGPMYNGQWDAANVTDPDGNGHIKLKVSNPTANSPFGAEIYTTGETFGYGTYTYVLGSRVDNMNKALVVGGMFTYDSGLSPHFNEIDIGEISAWGGGASQTDPVRLGHVMWYDNSGAAASLAAEVDMTTDVITTHRMTWGRDKVIFESFVGEGVDGALIKRTVFTTNIPTPNNEQVLFNFWVFDSATAGSADPATVPETEITIRDFSFTPLTDTFASAAQVGYTAQLEDALAAGDYTWRARAIDPAGSNTYGAWTGSRTFTILDATAVAITKSLQYAIKTVGSIAKSLGYEIETISSITKGMTYAVKTPQSVTKSLAYEVQTANAITKSLQYHVPSTGSVTINKSLQYEVVTTAAATTKSLSYEVVTSATVTKSLAYEVATSTSVTKSLAYDVVTSVSVTKSLQYEVQATGSINITKSLAYRIITTASLTKSLAYSVVPTTAVTKSLSYEVITSVSVTKSLAYEVLAANVATKSLQYAVATKLSTTKSLTYSISGDAVTLTKSLNYQVVASASLTKSMQYAVDLGASSQTKALSYRIALANTVTKSLTYNIVTTLSAITKAMAYKVQTSTSLTKGLVYDVLSATAITKALTYEISNELYSRGAVSSLPTDTASLGTPYTPSEVTNVSTDDGVRVCQTGSEYVLHQFKYKHTDASSEIGVSWNGQTTLAPSSATVYLQVYNYNSAAWETLASNSAAAADTDFTLAGSVTANLANYYDGAENIVAVRVYQQVV